MEGKEITTTLAWLHGGRAKSNGRKQPQYQEGGKEMAKWLRDMIFRLLIMYCFDINLVFNGVTIYIRGSKAIQLQNTYFHPIKDVILKLVLTLNLRLEMKRNFTNRRYGKPVKTVQTSEFCDFFFLGSELREVRNI